MTAGTSATSAPASRAVESGEALDVLGIGFGPSNLALAIVLEEQARRAATPRPSRAAFIERQDRFGWHRGMLIGGADLQVSFLKDLVTMRDPTSDYSFLSYLHQKDRMPAFINQKTMYPSRVEFHDYLCWAADRLRHRVSYGLEAIDARPVIRDGDVRYIDVVARRAEDGRLDTYRTRNVVVAMGLEPYLPPEAPASPRAWHSAQLLGRLADVPDDTEQTFVVVGAGQSAAEATEYVHRRFPRARVHAVFSRYGYSPADDTPFVNGIFDPRAVDVFFGAPDEVKDLFFSYHDNTNYSVVDRDLIATLHNRVYEELVTGEPRLIIRNLSRVVEVRETGTGLDVRVAYLPDGRVDSVPADWLIYATGYRPRNPLSVLGEVGSYCKAGPSQALRVDRSHRVVTSGRMRCGIYVQGATESTHGISSTLLSTTAVRAGEIAAAITASLDPSNPKGR
ncbi:MAG: lysine N(6)-hydroxylase/L-ornithine N(5)-oxygenase family protein [Nocardiopsaceae bacterium]|nr:lysine N(6)-hydroxylase/L-ornithine N(5)-oxygenase family protein [Nocardiopsaceae bacterium]